MICQFLMSFQIVIGTKGRILINYALSRYQAMRRPRNTRMLYNNFICNLPLLILLRSSKSQLICSYLNINQFIKSIILSGTLSMSNKTHPQPSLITHLNEIIGTRSKTYDLALVQLETCLQGYFQQGASVCYQRTIIFDELLAVSDGDGELSAEEHLGFGDVEIVFG